MGKVGECPNCLRHFDVYNKKTTFCCRKCRDAYKHRVQRRLAQAESHAEYQRLWQQYNVYHKPIDGYPEIECPGCGVRFKPITSVQKYCCKKCGDRIRAHDPAKKALYKKNQERYASSSARHFIGRLLNKKSRGRHLNLDYVMGLYDAQQGLCALSGVPMTHVAGQGRIATNISIDRIDSNKGYEEGNIQLVCCAVNIAKSSWSQDEFIELCRKIVDYNKRNKR